MLPLAYLIPVVLAFSLPLDSHPSPACFGSGVSLCWNVLPPEFQKASFPTSFESFLKVTFGEAFPGDLI